MEFNVTFLNISKTQQPNEYMKTTVETRKMTLAEIETYMDDFPPYMRRISNARLQAYQTQSLRLINWALDLFNGIGKSVVYPGLNETPDAVSELDRMLQSKFEE